MMSHRIFNALSLLSTILLACTIILWVWSFWADSRNDFLSVSDNCHIGFFDGHIDFFSDRHGPYHGSVISLSSGEETAFSAFAERRGFGDTLGIYYRYFRWADSGIVLWTLSVTLLYPMIVFLVLPISWAWKRQRARATSAR
jgi:hypothetical protein